jgi:hypothetical protein
VILGMPVAAFTATHVILSLIALMSGIVVVRHLMVSRTPAGITALFLLTTVLTCAGGFLYRSKAIGPGHYIGAISLAILLPTVVAIYGQRLAGAARWIYALGAVALLYLNSVIAVIQTFIKVPFLKPLVTSLSSPALVVAQLALLALFLWLGTRAVKRFHPETDHHGRLALPI